MVQAPLSSLVTESVAHGEVPTPEAVRDLLEASVDVLAAAMERVPVALAGQCQEEVLEVAEAVESAARLVHALQLHVARAVNHASPAPVKAGVLVDHQGDLAVRDGGHGGGTGASAEAGDAGGGGGGSGSVMAAEVWWGSEPGTVGGLRRRSPYRRACDALAVRVRIPRREAARRIRLALDLTPTPPPPSCPDAEARPARFEHLAAVIGEVDHAAVNHVVRAAQRAQAVAGSVDADRVQAHLVEQVLVFDPDTVGRMADRVIAYLDPDGAAPREWDPHLVQGVTVGATRGGLTPVRIVVDALGLEVLQTVFDAGTNPRGAESPRRSGAPGGGDVGLPVAPETRTRSRLMLDVLLAACQAALRSLELGRTGGLPTQVVVTMPFTDLIGALRPPRQPVLGEQDDPGGPGSDPGDGHDLARAAVPSLGLVAPAVPVLPHVGPVPTSMVRHLACDADVIPAVLGTHSRVLDLGRSHRLFPDHLRLALTARDGGCTFPGCTIPATWCEAHHLTPWWEGGATSLDNAALLCSAHHHAIHTTDWRIARTPAGALRFTPPWAVTPGLTRNPHHHGH